MAPQRLTDDRGKLLAVYDPDTETLHIKAHGMKQPKAFDLKILKTPKAPSSTDKRDAV